MRMDGEREVKAKAKKEKEKKKKQGETKRAARSQNQIVLEAVVLVENVSQDRTNNPTRT